MSEEKKNNAPADEGKGRKPHPPRKRGYFIEPPTGEQQPRAEVKHQAPKQEQKPTATDAPAQGGNAPKHKKPRHKPKNKPPVAQNGEQAGGNNVTVAQTQQPKAQPTGEQSAKQNGDNAQSAQNPNRKKKNNRRPKPHREDAPKTENVEKAPAAKPAQKQGKPARPVREPRPVIEHAEDDYEEYKYFTEEPAAPLDKMPAPDDSEAARVEVVGIRFKSTGKVYYFSPKGLKLRRGSRAIVDTARGQEFGEVAMANSLVKESDIVPPLREVVRAATTADIEHHAANKQKEEEAFKICNEKISVHGLDMKLIDAQYTFDNSKLLFYFTSADRVDFRELVKDLAGVFRTRIELRQIGIRDEAKLMGGLGICGRPLCCTLFLSDFDQVSIKMAKEQNLSLNSAKISGICGRLMCCLRYEHEAYEYEIKRTPPVDSMVRTENGDGIVTEVNPLRGMIKVRLIASPDVPPKFYHRDSVTMLRKKSGGEKNNG